MAARSSPKTRSPGWPIDLFLRHLDELIEHLGIGRYGMLGHPWGGKLADTTASMPLWFKATEELPRALPPEILATLVRHEQDGAVNEPITAACSKSTTRAMCRLNPRPPELQRTFAARKSHPAGFDTMIGSHDSHVTGTLRDWDIAERCDRIAVPTLLISGRYDEASQSTIRPFADRIPDVRRVGFEQSSHMPHIEERRACMETVRSFLSACDHRVGTPYSNNATTPSSATQKAFLT